MNLKEAIKIIKNFGKDFFTCDFFYEYLKMEADPEGTIKWAETCIEERKVIEKARQEKYNLGNDIAPGANYMDRKRCFSIYFYTTSDCGDGCAKLKECIKQFEKEN